MAQLSAEQVYALARSAGLGRTSAVTATAIAGFAGSPNPGESHGVTDARGDLSLVTQKWGPSVGVWQIRSLHAHKGTGQIRDETRLTDPTFNARSMASISNGGTSWNAWTVWTSGKYRTNLVPAEKAAKVVDAGAGSDGVDIPILGGVIDAAGDLIGAGGDLAGNPLGIILAPLQQIADLFRRVTEFFSPENWKRIGKGVIGAWLIIAGFALAVQSFLDITPTDVAGAAAAANPAAAAAAAATT